MFRPLERRFKVLVGRSFGNPALAGPASMLQGRRRIINVQ